MNLLMKTTSVLLLLALLTLNLSFADRSINILNVANAQSGTDVYSCAEHPDDCNSSFASCAGGVKDLWDDCMINCPPYNGAPWLYCDGNSDPH
jgi:hypothetical protein